MENVKHLWFRLTRKAATYLLAYHLVMLMVAGFTLLFSVIPETNPFKEISIFSFALIVSVVTGCLGSSIFYSRKLYKSCISLDMTLPVNEQDRIRQLGIIYYYLIRPIYGGFFSLLICIATKSGAEFITVKGTINPEFPYLMILISFFIGYSSGDFIDYLEDKGKAVVQSLLNTKIKS